MTKLQHRTVQVYIDKDMPLLEVHDFSSDYVVVVVPLKRDGNKIVVSNKEAPYIDFYLPRNFVRGTNMIERDDMVSVWNGVDREFGPALARDIMYASMYIGRLLREREEKEVAHATT